MPVLPGDCLNPTLVSVSGHILQWLVVRVSRPWGLSKLRNIAWYFSYVQFNFVSFVQFARYPVTSCIGMLDALWDQVDFYCSWKEDIFFASTGRFPWTADRREEQILSKL